MMTTWDRILITKICPYTISVSRIQAHIYTMYDSLIFVVHVYYYCHTVQLKFIIYVISFPGINVSDDEQSHSTSSSQPSTSQAGAAGVGKTATGEGKAILVFN